MAIKTIKERTVEQLQAEVERRLDDYANPELSCSELEHNIFMLGEELISRGVDPLSKRLTNLMWKHYAGKHLDDSSPEWPIYLKLCRQQELYTKTKVVPVYDALEDSEIGSTVSGEHKSQDLPELAEFEEPESDHPLTWYMGEAVAPILQLWLLAIVVNFFAGYDIICGSLGFLFNNIPWGDSVFGADLVGSISTSMLFAAAGCARLIHVVPRVLGQRWHFKTQWCDSDDYTL